MDWGCHSQGCDSISPLRPSPRGLYKEIRNMEVGSELGNRSYASENQSSYVVGSPGMPGPVSDRGMRGGRTRGGGGSGIQR